MKACARASLCSFYLEETYATYLESPDELKKQKEICCGMRRRSAVFGVPRISESEGG